MEQQVFLRDHLQQIRLYELLRKARRERCVLQVRAVDELVNREQTVEVDGSIDLVEVTASEAEVL